VLFPERHGEQLGVLLDLAGALGEDLEQLVWHVGDLGLGFDDRSPPHAVAVGELGAQDRLVQPTEGALVVLEVVGVEGVPGAVGGPDLGGEHDVAVDLGVVLPGGRLLEHGHGQALGVGEVAAAVGADPGGAAVALDVVEHGLHGEVVGVEDAGVAGEAPPDRHALGRREGSIETGDGLDELAVAGDPVPERRAEPLAGDRVVAGQDGFEVLDGHGAGETEVVGLAARPAAGGFVAVVGVEVAGVVAGRCGGGPGVDRPHAEHARVLLPPAGTCLLC
jgi:hypothetical protein